MEDNKVTGKYADIIKLMELEDSKDTRVAWELTRLTNQVDMLTTFIAKQHGYHEKLDPTKNNLEPNLRSFKAMWEMLHNPDLPPF